MTEQRGFTYQDAGVDIDAGDRAVQLMKAHVRSTFTSSVIGELGAFGAMFAPDLSGYTTPVLVSSADGVGTKVKVAIDAGRHTTVGQCLVNHCINDILVQGARALFFLDYYAVGKLDPLVAEQVVEGLSIAAKQQGCSLIGGETAEMPDLYKPNEYDLAGFIVGIVDRTKIITGMEIAPGDTVIGIQSNGLHTNGYSLARKLIFEVAGLGVNDLLPYGVPVADELLRVHRCYAKEILPLLDDGLICGMAHITGGGLPGNLVRVLPEGNRAILDPAKWETQPIFTTLAEFGNMAHDDLYRTFNMGIGYTLVVRPGDAGTVLSHLHAAGVTAWEIGEIIVGERGVSVK